MGNCLSSKKPKSKSESSAVSSSESNESESQYSSERSQADSGYSSEEEKIQPKKLLLVGSGEAGKTTLFKIITKQKGKGNFSTEQDCSEYAETAIENLLETLRAYLEFICEEKEYETADGDVLDIRISEENMDNANLIKDSRKVNPSELDSNLVDAIKNIIKDEGFKTAIENNDIRRRIYIPDGGIYFIENHERVLSSDYVPTFMDILNCRDRTTGVTHEKLEYTSNNKPYNVDLYDVGGQRTERKAWAKVFQGVWGIIFVMASSEFDMKCFEDNKTNRSIESLQVLKLLNNSPNFTKTPYLVVFTKKDQLKEKLESGSKFELSPPPNSQVTFKEYKGDGSYKDVKNYIVKITRAQISNSKQVIHCFKNLVKDGVTLDKELDELLAFEVS